MKVKGEGCTFSFCKAVRDNAKGNIQPVAGSRDTETREVLPWVTDVFQKWGEVMVAQICKFTKIH